MSNPTYQAALDEATEMMAMLDMEPRSALKQSAADRGIEYGDEMHQFVVWAEDQLGMTS